MNIVHKHVEEIFPYDGSQIDASWAFREFGIYGSSVVTWIGPVNITPDNLKDFADVGLEIKSNWLPACKYENCILAPKASCHDI